MDHLLSKGNDLDREHMEAHKHSFVKGNNGDETRNTLVTTEKHDGETIIGDVTGGLGRTALHQLQPN